MVERNIWVKKSYQKKLNEKSLVKKYFISENNLSQKIILIKSDFWTIQKTHKLWIINAYLSIFILHYAFKRHHLAYSAAHYIIKAHVKFQSDWLKKI